MPRQFGLVLVALLCATLLLGRTQSPLYACTCGYPTYPGKTEIRNNFAREHNEIVFVGKVLTIEKKEIGHSREVGVYVTFAVNTIWKGDIPAEFALITSSSEASCGYTFQKDTTYLVFVGDMYSYGIWNSGLCSGNVEQPTQRLLSALGDGYTPEGLFVPKPFLIFGMRPLTFFLLTIGGGGYWLRRKKYGATNENEGWHDCGDTSVGEN